MRGATAACLAALTTSAALLSLPTNAEAPASMAAKIWSSPACMVSTTTPVVSLVVADGADDVEPVPVGQLQVGDDDVGPEVSPRRDALGDAAGLADDGHVVVALERAGEALADQLVVVNQ